MTHETNNFIYEQVKDKYKTEYEVHKEDYLDAIYVLMITIW